MAMLLWENSATQQSSSHFKSLLTSFSVTIIELTQTEGYAQIILVQENTNTKKCIKA